MTVNNNTICKINLNQFRVESNTKPYKRNGKLFVWNAETRQAKINEFLPKLSNKLQAGKVEFNANSKIVALGQTLSELSKIGQESSELLSEVLQDKYPWMNQTQIVRITNMIVSWGKINNSDVNSLDLPAGWSCPKADMCKSKADKFTGERKDFGVFVCYACKAETQYSVVRAFRWGNYDNLRNSDLIGKINLLQDAIDTNKTKVIRLHSSGDIFSPEYWEAIKTIATNNPELVIFGYTKILEYAEESENIDNLYLIYSVGGMDDCKAELSNVKKSFVELEYNSDAVCQNKDKYSQAEDFFKIILNENVYLNVH